jgi:hypothetical protein
MQIEIKITERRAELQGSCVLVCGNTGDTVKFIFDNEWGKYSNKTARFGFIKEGAWYYTDVLFDGAVCEIPMLSGIDFVEVGVYAGNLSTTTPARVPTKKSILCKGGVAHEPPPADVYNEIMEAVATKLSTTGGTVTGEYYKDGKAFIHEGNLDLLDDTDNVAIVKKATGNALTLDSSQAPLHGLKLFGKTEQDGTPTPDNPIELKSVGDSGSYEVGVYGRNILKYPYNETTKTEGGITFTDNGDGIITANGTATKKVNFVFRNYGNIQLQKGKTYVLSGCASGGNSNTYCIMVQDSSYTQIVIDYGDGAAFTAEFNDYAVWIRIYEGATLNNVVFKPQVELGTQATPYEPCNKQTLIINDTLRGIGDIADEKDFARGVKTERFKVVDLSTLNWSVVGSCLRSLDLQNTVHKDYNNPKLLAEKYTIKGWGNVGSEPTLTMNGTGGICVFNTDLTVTPSGLLVYALAEPIETPLTEAELNDYRALLTNKGTTTILSAEADAEVDFYVNKPNAQAVGNVHAQINKDYLKLQQAIITLGGSTL